MKRLVSLCSHAHLNILTFFYSNIGSIVSCRGKTHCCTHTALMLIIYTRTILQYWLSGKLFLHVDRAGDTVLLSDNNHQVKLTNNIIDAKDLS